MPRILQRRPTRLLLLAFAAAAAITGAAFAYFTSTGTGSATASVGTLTAATISTPATSGASVTITWTSPATLGNPSHNGAITYTVQRKPGAGSYASVASGPCSGSLPYGTNSCTDTLDASGVYIYRVIATFASWTAASNETSVDATVAVATSTTLISSNSPSLVGEQVSYTATVATTGSGHLTGTISFKDGKSTISCEAGSSAFDGTRASCTVAYAASDDSPHAITATYSGDKSFIGSTSNEIDQAVIESAQTTTATAPPPQTATSP